MSASTKIAASLGQLSSRLGTLPARFAPLIYQARVAGHIAQQVLKDRPLPTLATLPQFQLQLNSLMNAVKSGQFRQWTFRDVALGTVLAGEAATFFLLGEMLGRRSVVGYAV